MFHAEPSGGESVPLSAGASAPLVLPYTNETAICGEPASGAPEVAIGPFPMFLRLRKSLFVSGSADVELRTVPCSSRPTWSTSSSARLPGLGGLAAASGASTCIGTLTGILADGTRVTVPDAGGPLERTFAIVSVSFSPFGHETSCAQARISPSLVEVRVADQPVVLTVIAWNCVAENRPLGRYTVNGWEPATSVTSALLLSSVSTSVV